MSEVIDLSSKSRLKPKRSHSLCRHSSIYVVEHTRMLECQDCGAVIDPFDFLMKQAIKQQNYMFEIEDKKRQSDKLSQEIKELKRIKRNLKAGL